MFFVVSKFNAAVFGPSLYNWYDLISQISTDFYESIITIKKKIKDWSIDLGAVLRWIIPFPKIWQSEYQAIMMIIQTFSGFPIPLPNF